ncbi:RNA polymerase sigma-70 factor [Duganella sp. BJB488]|uniref:RNA polymerase sigma-70 factor n=1 Tax=unclassified Duganella TaxID=2636909 RepID=UPI000E351424|nr:MULTISPECIES: RNA polymerase sigma-70 factor [unclassified Duganella]RFP08267.1 RNA polymerase sigma-70 factor [Duganella sp. BJB489]RFP10409.1 RNA polymerase sigma-70 factor [Duganella sp. BJB488]RFP27423.1 RNA polymerase sigma-70 factor [Duganella sp. BJB480]
MTDTASPAELATFAALRPRLFSIAYRMLGTRADAEDVVQDAWLRWHGSDQQAVQSAEAWLVTVTTRLAIDRLRARMAERESYVGWWLPEPLVELDEHTPESSAELASEVSMAFLWVLERLSPEERAAFLMRQVFEHDYADIAGMLGKSESACRQMVHRAQERVQQQKPRFEVPKEQHRELLVRFMEAARVGDRAAMKAMMDGDVQLVADGGGKVRAFTHILHGAGRVAGIYWALENENPNRVVYRPARVNGTPGLLRYVDGKLESAQSFQVEDGRIVAIFIMRNPDKLTALPQII